MKTERLKDYYGPASRREQALQHVTKGGGDIIQFGVFSGASMAYIHEYYTKHNLSYEIMWGFDSFEGLPSEQDNVQINQDWAVGSFDARVWFEAMPDEIIARLYQDFEDFGMDSVQLIKGYFCDTLTPLLASEIAPLSFIDVDCDLYISAYQALNWVLSHKLIQPGTVIYYDDWGDGKRCNGGEYKAHNELMQKYGVKATLLYDNLQAAFKIEACSS